MKTKIAVAIFILLAVAGFWGRFNASKDAGLATEDLSAELEAIEDGEGYSYSSDSFSDEDGDPGVLGEELAEEGIQLAGEANRELFKTLGGASFVQKFCGDVSWEQDIEDMMDQQDPAEQPALKAAFEQGWAEAEEASKTETIPCESL